MDQNEGTVTTVFPPRLTGTRTFLTDVTSNHSPSSHLTCERRRPRSVPRMCMDVTSLFFTFWYSVCVYDRFTTHPNGTRVPFDVTPVPLLLDHVRVPRRNELEGRSVHVRWSRPLYYTQNSPGLRRDVRPCRYNPGTLSGLLVLHESNLTGADYSF